MGLSGLVTSSAKSSRLLPPADATSTVCQVRMPDPSKSPYASMTTGDESTTALFDCRNGSWPGGTNPHSSLSASLWVRVKAPDPYCVCPANALVASLLNDFTALAGPVYPRSRPSEGT